MRSLRSAAFLLPLLLLVAGCTTTSYQAERLEKPQPAYTTIAVGPVTAKDDELWHAYAVQARRALIEQLKKAAPFETVLDTVPDPLPPEAVKVSGEITEFDKGNVALRWIIGFGAGRARVVGHFVVTEPAGGTVLQFVTSKEYAGGAGIGGADMVDMDSLARKLGEATGDAIAGWARTGKLP